MSKHKNREQRKQDATEAETPAASQGEDKAETPAVADETPAMPMLPFYPVF